MQSSFERNPFGELLSLMSMEEINVWRKRCQEAGNRWLADILDDEIQERRIGMTMWNP